MDGQSGAFGAVGAVPGKFLFSLRSNFVFFLKLLRIHFVKF